MIPLAKIVVSLLPVIAFLAVLVFLDSYKLLSTKAIIWTLLVGGVCAIVSLFLNNILVIYTGVPLEVHARYVAPLIEEVLKALLVALLIRRNRIGFLVDAAIYGFAIGAGFGLIENIYYLLSLHDSSLALAIVRGFGTATMHGGTTAIFAVLAKGRSDRTDSTGFTVYAPALLASILIHSLFNHFILPPAWTTVVILVTLPALLVVIFEHSEQATREWLGRGMDRDMELLDLISSEAITDSHVGTYLRSMRQHLSQKVLFDMLCMLRIHLELSLSAKAMMMLRQSGFKPSPDPEIEALFIELKYLEKSIGPTGKLALQPFIHASRRELWQMYMLGK